MHTRTCPTEESRIIDQLSDENPQVAQDLKVDNRKRMHQANRANCIPKTIDVTHQTIGVGSLQEVSQ